MSILIHGVSMPKNGLARNIAIFEDGSVRYYGGARVIGRAIELPPHGRLIDADKIEKKSYEIKSCVGRYSRVVHIVDVINAETIIPADPEKEDT